MNWTLASIAGVILILWSLMARLLKNAKEPWNATLFALGILLIGARLYADTSNSLIEDLIIPGIYLQRAYFVFGIIVSWCITVALFDNIYPPCGNCVRKGKLSIRTKQKYGPPFPVDQSEIYQTWECAEQIVCKRCEHVFSEKYIHHSTTEVQRNFLK